MAKIKDTMTPEMRQAHTDFYGNVDRLKGEWELCNAQYKEVMDTLKTESATFEDRMEIRKITDYWVRRRQALERALPDEVLTQFKK